MCHFVKKNIKIISFLSLVSLPFIYFCAKIYIMNKNKQQTSTPSIKKNFFYHSFYQILAMLTPLITAPYLSRVLGPAGIGIHSYTSTITSYFAIFGCLGISTYGAREIARYRDDKYSSSKIFYELVILKLMMFAIAIVGFMGLILAEKEYAIYYLALTLILLSNMIDIAWFFKGNEDFKKVSLTCSGIKIIHLILVITLVRGENALLKYFIIHSGTEFLGSMIMWMFVRKFLCKVKFEDLEIKRHFKDTFVFFIPTIATSIYYTLDKAMLKWIVGSEAENGYYEQSRKLIRIMEAIVLSINGVMESRMSYLYKQGKNQEMQERVFTSFNLIFIIAFPMIFGISAIANKFVPLFFGDGFEKVIKLIPFMSPLVLITGINNCLCSHYFNPCGKRRQANRAIIFGVFVNVAFNMLLIPFFNSYGAIIASIFAEAIIMLILFIYSKNFVKFLDVMKYAFTKLFAGIVMFAVVFCLGKFLPGNILSILIQITTGAITYFGILFLFQDKLLIKETKKIISKIKTRLDKNKAENID